MSNTPPCCPIERFIEHSAEHFIDRRSEGPHVETFAQLVGRRADNIELLIRFLRRIVEKPEAGSHAASFILALTGLKMAEHSLRRIHNHVVKEVK